MIGENMKYGLQYIYIYIYIYILSSTDRLGAADNSFARVLKPHGGAYILSSIDR